MKTIRPKKCGIVFAVIALLGVVIAMPRLRSGGAGHSTSTHPANPSSATNLATQSAVLAINSLGVDLLTRATKADENCVVSPYSIQCALAMAYAGADGRTRAEMAKALHYVRDEAELHRSFAALQQALDEQWKQQAQNSPPESVASNIDKTLITLPASAFLVHNILPGEKPADPFTLTVANSLFGQKGYDFCAPFLALAKDNYGAPLQTLDFAQDAAGATKQINQWVEDQTRQRIRDLIPEGKLNPLTRLVLVNAVYLKAPWASPFAVSHTGPHTFYEAADKSMIVATMTRKGYLGYARRKDFSVVTLPYGHRNLQFLILLPDSVNGLAGLERGLTSGLLNECAQLESREVILYLPKFKLEPPMFPLSKALLGLGIKSAFDEPRGSADFSRIAPRRPDAYLYLSEVFHKTFLSLDEEGTEAAAATAVLWDIIGGRIESEEPKPIEVRVDHPFLFAIQHPPSGACLFLGRVTDPR
jgi:serpin B